MPFRLQFDPKDIPALVKRYGPDQDNAARAAGARIAKGVTTHKELSTIFEWKTRGRGRTRLDENTDAEIADALSLACKAKTERAAVAVLCGLHGVSVPVASAILTSIDPERYTIIDYRALEALGCKIAIPSIQYYLDYLDACRRIAAEHKASLRNLDRAMWQWSKERQAK